ncbi:hypothetical protein [Novipirellula rosea]
MIRSLADASSSHLPEQTTKSPKVNFRRFREWAETLGEFRYMSSESP